jgi:hypothetical protein
MEDSDMIKKRKKSQISMEFLMSMGLLSIIFASALVINNFRREDVNRYKEMMELKGPCDKVTSMISNVHAMGHGASIKANIDYNMTILGQTRQILIWEKKDMRNLTYYCSYMPYGVTNAYNTSFTIPSYSKFTITNFFGNVEIYDDSLNDGLVLWLRMDEYDRMRTIEDWSDKKHNNIEINNTVNCNINGFRNKACYFDGNTGYINISEQLTTNESGTISLWFNRKGNSTTSDSYEHLISGRPNETERYYIMTRDTSKVYVNLNHAFVPVFIDNINNNQWYNIILSWDSGYYNVYLNGTKKIDNSPYLVRLNPTGWILGRLFDKNGHFFNGTIDDVKVYNRSLTQKEVTRLYESYFNYVERNIDRFVK